MSQENKRCPECAGTDLYVRGGIGTRGGYGPDLLPGTSGIFAASKMKAVVCKDCGLIRYYAPKDTLAKVNADNGWQRLL